MRTMTREIGVEAAVGRGRWLGLAGLVLSLVSVGLVLFVLVVALPTLAVRLNATTSDLQWIVGAFQLAVASLMLPAGFLGDRYGRKRGILGATFVFGIASLLGTQATTAGQLIAITTVMGAATAVLAPLTLSILPVMFPEESSRKQAIGALAAANFLTLPLGPLVGGWLLKNYSWDSIFWINVPLVVLALVGIVLFVPESRDPSARGLDVTGSLLSVAGVTSLVFGIIRVPIEGWTSGTVVGTVTAGVLLLAGFIFWESRSREPLVDLGLFKKPAFSWSTAALGVAFFALVGGMFVLTPFLQVVQGNDVMATGIRLIPLIIALVVAAVASDRLAARFGARAMLAGGLALLAGGLLLLSRVTAGSGYTLVGVSLTIIGLGVGAVLAPAFDAVLTSLPEEQRGVGSALANATGKLAQAIGIVIMGTILNNAYRSQLDPHLAGLPARVHDAAQASVAGAAAVAAHLPPAVGASLLRNARDAYTNGMSEVLVLTALVALVAALVIAVLLPRQNGQAVVR